MDKISQGVTTILERTSPTQVAITVRVPYQELELFLAKATERISEETEIEGFRKGKAPYEVVKQKVGEFKILEEAARLYIQKNFPGILEDIENKEYTAKGQSFEPVGEPQIAITKLALGEEFEFKITLSLLPGIELPNYQAIAKRVLATKKVPATTEKEVRDALEWLRESRAKLVTVNRGAALGDRVEVDFSAAMGGVQVEGGESKNHPFILGKGRFVPGFEEAIAGMKAGEEKEFMLGVPADYRDKSIAGKTLEFKTKMNLVQERDVPGWGDAFVKSLGNFDSASAVEKSIRDGLATEKEGKERERIRMAMVDAIAGETKADLPTVLIDREIEKMITELQESIKGMGLKFEDYLTHIKKSADDLKREWRGDAEHRVKIALLLREIAKREHIEPSEEDVQAAMNHAAAHRGMNGSDRQGLDPVRGKSPGATAAPSARASNGVDREAFSSYHVGVARNEKVFEFLENIKNIEKI